MNIPTIPSEILEAAGQVRDYFEKLRYAIACLKESRKAFLMAIKSTPQGELAPADQEGGQ